MRKDGAEALCSGNSIIGNKKYIIRELIGYGGSSLVYSGYYVEESREISVIIKEIYPQLEIGELYRDGNALKVNNGLLNYRKEFVEQIFDTYKKMAQEESSFFTKLLSKEYKYTLLNYKLDFIDDYNNTAYIVYHKMNGKILNSENGTLGIKQIVNRVKRLLECVSEFHKCGYYHLDISPDNIWITELNSSDDPIIILIDYGSVREKENLKNYLGTCSSFVMKDGYSAPEIVKRCLYFEDETKEDPLGEYTDVFSVTAVMYWLLTGKTHDLMVSSNHWKQELHNNIILSQLSGPIIEWIDIILEKGLNTYKKRYQSCSEMLIDIIELEKRIENKAGFTTYYLTTQSKLLCNKEHGEYNAHLQMKLTDELIPELTVGNMKNLTLEKYIKENTRNALIIAEEGGAGKTTMLLQSWSRILDINKNDIVPFYIPLKKVLSSSDSGNGGDYCLIRKYIANVYGKCNDVQGLNELFSDIYQQEQFLLLMDGYNEISGKLEERDEIRKCIISELEILNMNPNVQIIITSRYDSYYSVFNDYERIKVNKLNNKIIEKWIGKENYEKLDKQRKKRLLRLLENPMLLSIYCNVKECVSSNMVDSVVNKIETAGELLEVYYLYNKDKKHDDVIYQENIFVKKLYNDAINKFLLYLGHYLESYAKTTCDENEIVTILYEMQYMNIKNKVKIPIENNECFIKYETIERNALQIINLLEKEYYFIRHVEEDRKIEFIHENYRDFFAAYYIFDLFKLYKDSREFNVEARRLVEVINEKEISFEVKRYLGELLKDYKGTPRLNTKKRCWTTEVTGSDKLLDLCRYYYKNGENVDVALQNIFEILRILRDDDLSGVNLSNLDLRKLKMNNVRFNRWYNDKYLCACFEDSYINENNLESKGHSMVIFKILKYEMDKEKYLITVGMDNKIRVWDFTTMLCKYSFKKYWLKIKELCVYQDNLFIVSEYNIIYKIKLPTLDKIEVIRKIEEDVRKIGVYNGQVKYYNFSMPTVPKSIEKEEIFYGKTNNDYWGSVVEYNPINEIYLRNTELYGNAIIAVDEEQNIVKEFKGHSCENMDQVIQIAWDNKFQKFISVLGRKDDCEVIEWDYEEGKILKKMLFPKVKYICYSFDNESLLIAFEKSSELIEYMDERVRPLIKGSVAKILDFILHPFEKYLFVISEDCELYVTDLIKMQIVKIFKLPTRYDAIAENILLNTYQLTTSKKTNKMGRVVIEDSYNIYMAEIERAQLLFDRNDGNYIFCKLNNMFFLCDLTSGEIRIHKYPVLPILRRNTIEIQGKICILKKKFRDMEIIDAVSEKKDGVFFFRPGILVQNCIFSKSKCEDILHETLKMNGAILKED